MTGAIVQRSESYLFPVTGQPVRTVTIDGEPWFVGRDVAEVLGYANTSKALKDHVPAGHRKGNGAFPLAELGFHPQTVMIDEPGMCRLVLRANTDLAERFQEWVTAEVLPAIRKTGSYSAPPTVLPDLTAPENVLALANLYQSAARQLVAATQRVAELEPAAEAWEVLASADGDYSLRDAGHMLNRV